ncbi:hypothetical protein L1281_001240 [Neisseria sp. HSC-16F19]|nr:transferrin-binding protein-like solute binding protein [Neisseria sp. HSC-16F19]MCP2040651.1 hypothetical protein [Neisseria sp. HSC-16F19]
MYSAKNLIYLCGTAVCLSACATGKGGFETDRVQFGPGNGGGQSGGNTTDVTTPPRTPEQLAALEEPALGSALPSIRRNILSAANQAHAPLSADSLLDIGSSDGLTQPGSITTPGTLMYTLADDTLASDSPEYDIVDSYAWRKRLSAAKQAEMATHYVRAGYVVDEGRKRIWTSDRISLGPEGFVYYQGTNPATALPNVSATVTYKGTWDFATDVRAQSRGGSMSAQAGNRFSAFSMHDQVNRDNEDFPLAHSSEFSVDFNEKKLSGELWRNSTVRNGSQTRTKLYDIEASLHGNRFRGKATATGNDQNIVGEYFKDNSSTLEGGFFGPNAEELAGKFLTDNSSLFAVFAAKRDSGQALETQTLFDAQTIDIDTGTHTGIGNVNPANTFGNATKLVVGGKSFSLLPDSGNTDYVVRKEYGDAGSKLIIDACCSNLNYIKFGKYFTEGSSRFGYYLSGERTSLADMAAQSGQAQYLGSWEGTLTSRDGTRSWVTDAGNPRQSGSRAQLNVDFGSKTFTGGLYAANATSPMINLAGTIAGNAISGTAKTGAGGFNLDAGSTGAAYIAHIDAAVSGAFYGPNAQEIAGTVHGNQNDKDKIGAVFGAKRQQ